MKHFIDNSKKLVIVSGAGSGIGKAVAIGLAQTGKSYYLKRATHTHAINDPYTYIYIYKIIKKSPA